MIPRLIASGHIAAPILIFTFFELLGFAALRRIWNIGPPLAKLLPSIAAGDFLLLAWWFSATHWAWSAAALLAALAAHGTDVATRLGPATDRIPDPVSIRTKN